ncbi:MAG: hypothetical protein WAU41_13970 [Gaiellaceae bacterium]
MGTPAAPRIDERLRRYIAGSSRWDTPAEITRLVGQLAWDLALPRPSYQQVRLLVRELRDPHATAEPSPPPAHGKAWRIIDTLYEYPGPGLADWYERYKRGAL